MYVDSLARAGREVVDDEVRWRGRAIEPEELDLTLALAVVNPSNLDHAVRLGILGEGRLRVGGG